MEHYPRVLIIPTHKTDKKDREVLIEVLKQLDNQKEMFDEVVLIKNYEKNTIIGHHCITPVTEIFFKKTEEYQLSSTINFGLDYIIKKYFEFDKIFIGIIGDDCIMESFLLGNVIALSTKNSKVVFNPRVVQTEYSTDFARPNVEGHGCPITLTSVEKAVNPRYHVNAILFWLWHKEDWGARYDSNFDGEWGLEDTDFALQLIHRGYVIVPNKNRVWHIDVGWSKHLHQHIPHAQKIQHNPNWKYLKEKWDKIIAKQ